MWKIKIVKLVAPELVAYITIGGEKFPDYACPECGAGTAREHAFCPYCGAEFDWKHESSGTRDFRKLMENNIITFEEVQKG